MTDRASLWPTAREHFRRLCDLSEDERRAALQMLADSDATVAVYVAELLANDSQADDDLCGAVDGLRSDFEDDTASPGERTAGPWQLETRIGHGGMGEVWRARRNDSGFEQVAALKLLKRGMDSEALIERFLRERRILARLEHPNIARMLDGGMTDAGRPYFVMELVEGQPITEYIGQHDLGLKAMLRLFLRICAAVDFAHRNLVVHRDLKPSNILVDAEGEPKLLDFGIAKMLIGDDADSTVTMTQMRAMTPAYAAPEQLAGEAVTTSTDVYALGLILYQMITGALPAQRRSQAERDARPSGEDITTRPSQVLRRSGGDTDTSTRARRLAREVGGDLDAIVLTALRHDPVRRYPSAAAMAADIRNLLDGRPVSARADSVGYRVRRFVRRNRTAVATSALVIVALVTGLLTAMWQARVASQALLRMEAEYLRAEREFERAEAAKSFLIGLFEYTNPAGVQADATRTVRDLLLETDAAVAERLADQPLVQAEMRLSVATALRSYGELDAAVALAEVAVGQLRHDPEASPILLGVGLHNKAALLADRGKLSEAEVLVREAVQLLAAAPSTPGNARRLRAANTTLALILNATGRETEALALRRKDLEDRSRELGETHPDLATSWYNLAIGHMQQDQFPQALEALLRTETIVAPDEHRASLRYVYLWAALSNVHDVLGNGTLSRIYFERAWNMTQAHFGTHQSAPAFMNRLAAQLALNEQRFDDAEMHARRAWERSTGADLVILAHPIVTTLLVTGSYREAADIAETAAAASTEQRGADHAITAHMRAAAHLAQCLPVCDETGLAALEAEVELMRATSYRRYFGQAAAWLAFALRPTDPARARVYERDAETALASVYPSDHPWARSLAGSRWIGSLPSGYAPSPR
ncbi:MAG TPA: serine/threonine-protein kinase [Xanthomonadaceae bacterium]|nr:serine/threonine-protein kinase [Xanthomonadaceae bacterium]